jgi:hypothetical protein
LGRSIAMVCAVVATVKVNGVLEVALTLTLAGTEQDAPAGPPVHVRDAVPLNPLSPRMVRP